MSRELSLSTFWIFLNCELPAAILLLYNLGFTQRTVWHASVLAVEAYIPVFWFVYLVNRQQQKFLWTGFESTKAFIQKEFA